MPLKFLPAVLAGTVLTLSSCEKDQVLDQQPEMSMQGDQTAVSSESGNKYIVTLKDNNSENAEALAQKLLKGKMGKVFHGALKGFTADLSAEEVAELKNNEQIEHVEKDQEIQAYQTTSTTTTSSTQVTSWGATRVGMGSGVGKTAWVIDSGVQLSHPDLTVDRTRSRSFHPCSTSPDDQFGHGTMVAGIIGAKNNTYGARGVAAGATIVSLRVMDAYGRGMSSYVINALNHVALNGRPGDVVNLSFGGPASAAMDAAVRAVAAKGIFVTIAAGNSSANVTSYSPARVNATNVYTVSGLKAYDAFMGISNYGSPTVDYCAPGNSIHTTKKGSLYGSAGGTSMAAPHLAGILLIKGANIVTSGYVKSGDPDGTPDRIPHI